MTVQYQDYYETLGVKRDTPQPDIQRAYRKLARKVHPDVNKAKDAEEKFKKINEAYEVLKDPEKRKKYDSLGADWRNGQEFRPPPGWGEGAFRFDFERGAGRAHQQSGMGGFSDFFDAIFGDAAAGGAFGENVFASPRGGAEGATLESEIAISLAEACQGVTKEISFDLVERNPFGQETRKTKSYKVKIKPGTAEGAVIRLPGQGGQGRRGGKAGDLLLKVRLAPDPRFAVSGADLHTVVPITPWEAMLGGKVDVPTIDGEVKLNIPPGAQGGQKLRLKGKGLPGAGLGNGDMFVELKIMVPPNPSAEEEKLIKRLAEISTFNPRK